MGRGISEQKGKRRNLVAECLYEQSLKNSGVSLTFDSHLPSLSGLEQHKTPKRNTKLPERKIANMKMVNRSRPQNENSFGFNSGSGGFGHDDLQSTHEHAGRIPCKFNRNSH
jgi:hypothetical protein